MPGVRIEDMDRRRRRGKLRQHFDELAGRQLGGGAIARYLKEATLVSGPVTVMNDGKDRRRELPSTQKLNGTTSGASGA